MSVFRQMRAARVQRADLAIHQPPRLGLAHDQRPRSDTRRMEALFARIEQDLVSSAARCWRCGASRLMAIRWCTEPLSPYALARRACRNEPRRKAYWETELINALRSSTAAPGTPKKCAAPGLLMGHTQCLSSPGNLEIYDKDGRVSASASLAIARLQRALFGQPRQISPRRTSGLMRSSRRAAPRAVAETCAACVQRRRDARRRRAVSQANASAQRWGAGCRRSCVPGGCQRCIR